MEFKLPDLPYAKNALAPHISEETLDFHHGKHHNTYVTKLNGLIPGTEFGDKSLGEIVLSSSGKIFNNAAQVFNHSFYWNCLTPNSTHPGADLKDAIDAAFGSMDEFVAKFSDNAANNFGSGWTWLVSDASGTLSIVNTGNAATPLTDGLFPVLTCDVWEHAYYIDFRNKRPDYLKAFFEIANWAYASDNYANAKTNPAPATIVDALA